MLAAMAVFVFNDTLVKLAAAHIPTGEAIFVRGVFSTSLCFILIVASGLTLGPAARAVAEDPAARLVDIGSSVLFLVALVHMPIGDVFGIIQFTPLAITAGAALFLGREGRLAAMAGDLRRPGRRAHHRPAGGQRLQSLRLPGARLARCSRRRATSSRAASPRRCRLW